LAIQPLSRRHRLGGARRLLWLVSWHHATGDVPHTDPPGTELLRRALRTPHSHEPWRRGTDCLAHDHEAFDCSVVRDVWRVLVVARHRPRRDPLSANDANGLACHPSSSGWSSTDLTRISGRRCGGCVSSTWCGVASVGDAREVAGQRTLPGLLRDVFGAPGLAARRWQLLVRGGAALDAARTGAGGSAVGA